MEETPAVEVRDVTKRFAGPTGKPGSEVVAVDDVTLTIRNGEFFALLGPSGCGKTTTLRMIAGFEHPTAGEIYIHSKPMGLTPPYQRTTNMVFQNYALFPHMTVARNVGFGLEMKRVPKAERERRVREALAMVRLPGFGPRRPNQLSGGQQQRIALARALVNRPEVLLLDEPLGALDLKLRKEMQLELKNLQQEVGITFIYVTHDQEEALTMSDRIAVMHQGKVLQVGTPGEIYERPVCRFVADFIGESNFLAGVVQEQHDMRATLLVDGRLTVAAEADRALRPGDQVTVAVRPEKVRLSAGPLPGGANAFAGLVEQRVYVGTATVFQVRLSDQVLVTAREQNVTSAAERGAGPWGRGSTAWVTWPYDAGRVLLD